jgi:hypothetical protein
VAIAKKPKRSTGDTQTADPEKAASAFIAGAGSMQAESVDARKVPVMIRFDRDLLRRIDTAARSRGVSRSAWVTYTLSGVLDEDQRGV